MKTMTVRGAGILNARPDRIELEISLNVTNESYETAFNEANRLTGALRKDLTAVGYASDELKTLSYVVDAEYENVREESGEYRRVMKGYRCAQRFSLSFACDLGKLGETLSALAASEARTEFSVKFTLADREEAGKKLLTAACEDAAAKAAILAWASGVKLGAVTEIRHDSGVSSFYSETVYRPQQLRMAAANAPDIAPEDVKVEDSVTITWELL